MIWDLVNNMRYISDNLAVHRPAYLRRCDVELCIVILRNISYRIYEDSIYLLDENNTMHIHQHMSYFQIIIFSA